jgi:hypothetical protein
MLIKHTVRIYVKLVFKRIAPTRGATNDSLLRALPNMVSIHAPTRGATRRQSHQNLTPVVSIHAPTRGATAPKKRALKSYH